MPSSSAALASRARDLLGGQRALVVGLAREGVDLTRFLSAHGASVLVTDNPGCILHLRGTFDAAGLDVQVKHVAQLLAERLGG